MSRWDEKKMKGDDEKRCVLKMKTKMKEKEVGSAGV